MKHLSKFFSTARIAICMLAVTISSSPLMSYAQTYPTKPIRAIIPYTAGGSTDVTLRRIANAMNLGQPIVVENRPGANTIIGTQSIIDAPPDGYTLGFVTAALTANQALIATWNIDPIKQLAPISAVVGVPTVYIVNPAKYKTKSLAEFIAIAKANPGGMFFASSGGTDVFAFNMFNAMAGTKIDIVPFKGEADVIQAIMRGDVDAGLSSLGSVRRLIEAGSLPALGVTSLRRSSMFPDIPTFDESHLKGYEFISWSGFVAPAGTPQPIIIALNRSILAALRSPEVAKSITDLGNYVMGTSPEEFSRMIVAEIAKWNGIAKASGIKPR